MDAITIQVDAELATEYIRRYREFSLNLALETLDDEHLLLAFVHDRLREETEFIRKENE